MHSQRAYSSTVSTGLSTVFQRKSGGISRFSPKISTLSTGFPQALSTWSSFVDMHVDIPFFLFLAVYTCNKHVYICITLYSLSGFHEKSGLIHPQNPHFRNFSFVTKTPHPQRILLPRFPSFHTKRSPCTGLPLFYCMALSFASSILPQAPLPLPEHLTYTPTVTTSPSLTAMPSITGTSHTL